MKQRIKRIFLAAARLALVVGALTFVFYNTDIKTIKFYIVNSDVTYLLLAYLALNLAMFIGALRLKIYFTAEKVNLPKWYAVIIYYIGLFFNTVFPGGIGGDGYITIHLRRKFNLPALQVIRILLTTRANGLFFLNLFFFILLYLSDFAQTIPSLKIIIISLFLLQLPVYAIAARYILKEKFSTFIKAGFFSLISQIFSLLTAYLVFKAIGINDNYINYLSLYLAAAIVAILPISPGGVGLREFIFFQGARYIPGLDEHVAVAASLVYFAVYFAVSLSGLALYLLVNKIHINNKGSLWH